MLRTVLSWAIKTGFTCLCGISCSDVHTLSKDAMPEINTILVCTNGKFTASLPQKLYLAGTFPLPKLLHERLLDLPNRCRCRNHEAHCDVHLNDIRVFWLSTVVRSPARRCRRVVLSSLCLHSPLRVAGGTPFLCLHSPLHHNRKSPLGLHFPLHHNGMSPLGLHLPLHQEHLQCCLRLNVHVSRSNDALLEKRSRKIRLHFLLRERALLSHGSLDLCTVSDEHLRFGLLVCAPTRFLIGPCCCIGCRHFNKARAHCNVLRTAVFGRVALYDTLGGLGAGRLETNTHGSARGSCCLRSAGGFKCLWLLADGIQHCEGLGLSRWVAAVTDGQSRRAHRVSRRTSGGRLCAGSLGLCLLVGGRLQGCLRTSAHFGAAGARSCCEMLGAGTLQCLRGAERGRSNNRTFPRTRLRRRGRRACSTGQPGRLEQLNTLGNSLNGELRRRLPCLKRCTTYATFTMWT
mmetsp:Transcript_89547/g.208570  ORF Transcript_89547/g.208570 Transcript_89547/m.208570 type:complete len:460 (+) Transcript_89547:85-1464(+)